MRGRRIGVAALLVAGTLFRTRVRTIAEFGGDAAPLRPTAHPGATGV